MRNKSKPDRRSARFMPSSSLLSSVALTLMEEGLASQNLQRLCRNNDLTIGFFASGTQSLLYTVRERRHSAVFTLKLPRSADAGPLDRERHFLRALRTAAFPRVIFWSTNPPFLYLEHVRGPALAELSLVTAVAALPRLVHQLAAALADMTARHRPIIHRNIAPRHLVVRPARIVLVDLGSAE
jgi:predicted Ser/Thr protein kinase